MGVTRRDWIRGEALVLQRLAKPNPVRRLLWLVALFASLPLWFLPNILISAREGRASSLSFLGLRMVQVQAVGEGIPGTVWFNFFGWTLLILILGGSITLLTNKPAYSVLIRFLRRVLLTGSSSARRSEGADQRH